MKIEQLNGVSNAEQMRSANRLGANRTTGSEARPAPGAANPTPPADQVYISPQAETIARLVARVREMPDIRQERVESLRAIATSGAYHPSAADIADAIIGDENPSPQ
jgi:flagellar biosynthesis anti-sigma factor FlgM